MASFQDAFRKGLEAHDSADRARREITSVFDECARQVREASGEVLSLSREDSVKKDPDEKRTVFDQVRGVLHNTISYKVFMAKRVEEPLFKKGEELCEYRLSPEGYPVLIKYADVDEYCHDKQALEHALVELLKHPETGGKLQRLMDPHLKQASEEAGPPAAKGPMGEGP